MAPYEFSYTENRTATINPTPLAVISAARQNTTTD
jgi:hypothetical protein